uniref:Putative ovule protein n=1 Tax=Solanum chacoense TaxID=4108 RepID=A0A0V0HAK2_SOLCH
MHKGRTKVLAPPNTAGCVKILLNKVAALLKMVNTFDTVAPTELFTEDLGFFNVDPLLPHQMLPHLEESYRILIRVIRVEIIGCSFIELYSFLPPHFFCQNLLLLLSN